LPDTIPPKVAKRLKSDGLAAAARAIGAYRDTLALMRRVGVDPQQAMARVPMKLIGPGGFRLQAATLPAPFHPLNLAIGLITALAWVLSEDRRAVRPRLILAGIGLQILLALLLLVALVPLCLVPMDLRLLILISYRNFLTRQFKRLPIG
jgi:hypothetical protein